MEPTIENQKPKESFLKEVIVFTSILVLVTLPIRMYIAQPFLVSGASMEPTFDTGDYLIVDQVTYRLTDPKRGDVVIFRYPEDPSKFFIKRIIGLPGEKVNIRNGEVTVTTLSGQEIEINEPYVFKIHKTTSSTQLSDDEYFVMGDNRISSADSRTWGPLKEDLLIGRALFRLYPLNEINYLPGKVK